MKQRTTRFDITTEPAPLGLWLISLGVRLLFLWPCVAYKALRGDNAD